ncbi:MAG: class I SAM-dependent methyltransferase [Planctomycetes bacterium]|nr:class I SAM-dependent methyltransferase [Planctomycetota bacterium]
MDPTPRCDAQLAAARARVRALVSAALEQGAPTAWFDELYREAAGDAARVPWADLVPNAALAAWTARPEALAGVRTAVVVGCGLGHDAEHLASLGLEVTAFDVSEHAIRWARTLHGGTRVRYEVADLFALPSAWRGAFDLVVEVDTWQALPRAVRAAAVAATRALLAPGGRLFVFARLRDDGPGAPPMDERRDGPPWPLGHGELARAVDGLTPVLPFRATPDAADPSIVRGLGVWRRT